MDNKEINQEIKEAMEAGEAALEHLKMAQSKLESAGDWGLFDIFGGGVLTSVVKKTKINEAKEHVEEAKIQIRRFEKELKDIDDSMELNIEIDKFMLFADVFFDSAVIDVVVQSRIKELKKQVSEAIDRIEKVMEMLKGRQ